MATPEQELLEWPEPVEHPPLEGREVHIWRAFLVSNEATLNGFRELMSNDEQRRADRFHFKVDCQRFITARGWLRILLGRYLSVKPGNAEFVYDSYGKPRLANSDGQERSLHFNLAHSKDLTLYAFTRIGEIGIDLECVQRQFSGDDIARRFFSESEVASLSELPTELRRERFFTCWTRKEAFIKAKGKGLSLPLNQFDVSLGDTSPLLLRTKWNENEAALWSLKQINAGPGYVATVAIESHGWKLLQWQVGNIE